MLKEKFTGVKTQAVREYEIRHRELARRAAAEGFVLMENKKNILPLTENCKIALYGTGVMNTVKGGTGSGDVNERHVVSIYEGLKHSGFEIVNETWLKRNEEYYQKAREEWRNEIWTKSNQKDPIEFFNIYSSTPFKNPIGDMPMKENTDIAIFVLSRIAGEGTDRYAKRGDYYLDHMEEKFIKKLTELYPHVIVLLNVGGIQDCSFWDKYDIDCLVNISQPGMEAGNAVADMLLGHITPSGKLTDSWAYNYEDYPNYNNFSHNNENIQQEFYNEGIYVGYRYFDTFQVPVRYGFGYGLSYTKFCWELSSISRTPGANPIFTTKVTVYNIGNKYSGSEVIQLYVSCPQKTQEKEFRRLIGFAKTRILKPGQKEEIEIRWTADSMTSYLEKDATWTLEKGCYGIYIGNELNESKLVASLELNHNCIYEKLENVCIPKESIWEFKNRKGQVEKRRNDMIKQAQTLPIVRFESDEIVTKYVKYDDGDGLNDSSEMKLVDNLSVEQLIQLATGVPDKREGSNLGASGFTVPGSAAETSLCALEEGIKSIVLADGPAGLRLNQSYQVIEDEIVQQPFEMSFEKGFFYKGKQIEGGDTYYQYCTAFPIGTLLAQSWNKELVKAVGKAVGEEMNIFHVSLWLAPGMCIHRNPLCGRNFEYYSEDPFVSGSIAAAMTAGVQSISGCGTTIKHLCCNNQEDNRMHSNSILSERTLREIYLKGFEIAVKKSQPLSIMTSYNLINGIHAANNYDICTKVVRKEWEYKGLIMTDWTTTHNGPDCTASGCMRAGNDLVMPGRRQDHENMRMELEKETLTVEQVKKSITHLVRVIRKLKNE